MILILTYRSKIDQKSADIFFPTIYLTNFLAAPTNSNKDQKMNGSRYFIHRVESITIETANRVAVKKAYFSVIEVAVKENDLIENVSRYSKM